MNSTKAGSYEVTADGLHALLALLLLLQQLAFTAHVATVTLGQHVLPERLDRRAGDDLPTDGCLDRHVEHLPRDQFLHFLHQLAALVGGVVAVDDQGEGVDLLAIDQHVETNQVGRLETIEAVVQGSIAAAGGLEAIEEVEHHLVHRQVVDHLHLAAEEVHVALHAALLDAQGDHVAQVVLGHQDGGAADRFAHFLDRRQVRELGRVVDVDDLAVLLHDLEDHRGRGGDQVQVVFALQALLDDLHVQHAEEAATEAEAQGFGAFRLVLQRRVVEGQFLQGVAEVLEIVRADREQARVDLRLDPLEARQDLDVRRVVQGQRIAHRRAVDILDTGDDEAHLARLQVDGLGVLRSEYPDAVHLVDLAGGLHQDLVALLHPAVLHPYQRDHAKVVVEPGVDDQRLQRRLDLAFRGGDGGHPVGDGLRLDALAGVHYQQRALAGGQRAADFVGEVDVAGGIDEVELVGLTVLRLVVQGHAVGLDGDPALALQVHGVQDLGLHFAIGEAAAHLDEAIGQRRLAMVDMGNDGEIADMAQVAHGSTHSKRARAAIRRKIAGEFT